MRPIQQTVEPNRQDRLRQEKVSSPGQWSYNGTYKLSWGGGGGEGGPTLQGEGPTAVF